MDLLFAIGCATVIIFIVYNLICYKNKKSVYMLNYKYVVLIDDYYNKQLMFELLNSFLLLTFYSVWYIFIKNSSVFIFGTLIIFWGVNYTLELYSIKKGYISIKEKY